MKTYTIILCGATGDLATRKIIPGLYDVMRSDATIAWRIIGLAHDKMVAAEMMQLARGHIRNLDEGIWYAMCEQARYVSGDFAADAPYRAIADLLKDHNEDRLVYCATSSEFFVPITEKCIEHGIIRRQDTDEEVWHRIAYEKPFGHDAISALQINTRVTALMNEFQIYRVDHYLAKKASMAIPAARMLDETFNNLWTQSVIESIQVVVSEVGGIGQRGRYYDQHGALKDMVQNHLLQTVALLLVHDSIIDYPELCHEKLKVLQALTVVDCVLGQYEGYRAEPHVAAASSCDTFAALRLSVALDRWNQVPIFIKTGKKLARAKMVIHALFRSNDQERVSDMPLAVIGYGDNEVRLVIGEPEIEHALTLTAGEMRDESEMLHAYGRIFEFIMQGDKTIFISFAEIAESWRIVDGVSAQRIAPAVYAVGSNGPEELEEFNRRNAVKWIV